MKSLYTKHESNCRIIINDLRDKNRRAGGNTFMGDLLLSERSEAKKRHQYVFNWYFQTKQAHMHICVYQSSKTDNMK